MIPGSCLCEGARFEYLLVSGELRARRAAEGRVFVQGGS